MSKILRTLTFILVLAGLLAWGVMSMAGGSAFSTLGDKAFRLQGHITNNGTPVSPGQVHHVKF